MMQSEIETTRADAGIGCLLKWDEDGKFNTVPAFKSGLNLHGDVRDMKLISLGDKLGLLVTQNNGPLRLFLSNTENK